MRGYILIVGCLLLGLLGLFAREAGAQSVLSGQVTDIETGEPVFGANLILSFTTLGSGTSAEGRYRIASIPPGVYDVAVSAVGYQTTAIRLELYADSPERTLNIGLRPVVYDLEDVVVAAEQPRDWARNLERFRDLLLGPSSNAKKTVLLNPYVLDFGNQGGRFTATTRESLVLVNKSLGYRITFLMDSLWYNARLDRLKYTGYPHFEPLNPESESEVEVWKRNRKRAYYGSLQHLLWALINDRVAEEGFTLHIERRVSGPSADEMAELQPVDRDQIIQPVAETGLYRLQFNHLLRVTYLKQSDGFSWAFWSRQGTARQVSWLKMDFRGGLVHEDGTLYPPDVVSTSGHMTRYRLADRLPRGYYEELLAEASGDQSPVVITESGFPQDPYAIYKPESDEVLHAVQAMRQKKWDNAVWLLENAIQKNPEHLEAHYYRAIAHREFSRYRTLSEFKHWKAGIEDFYFILRRDSSYRDVLHQLALYSRIPTSKTDLRALNVGLQEAIRLGHEQIRRKPGVGEHQFHLYSHYQRYVRQTDPQRALIWLRERAEEDEWAAFFVGDVLRRMGRGKAAEAAFSALLDRSLDMPPQPIYLALARMAYAHQDPEAAEQFIGRAIAEIERPVHAAFVFEDLKYILTEGELALYRTLQRSVEFVTFFNVFWSRRDPTPAYSYNVRLAEHYRRLKVAEAAYAFEGLRTWFNNPDKMGGLALPETYTLNQEFNDKGLIYLRHGEPSERITTLGGDDQLGAFKSSSLKGFGNQREVFLPREQSHKAPWLPNESWRYRGLDLDFHFVIDEGAGDNNWRLTPSITNYAMLQDRMVWGGLYLQMARMAGGDTEDYPPSRTSNNEQVFDLAPEVAADFAVLESKMADVSREMVDRALKTDRHTWSDDTKPYEIPYLPVAFRGSGGFTHMYLYYDLTGSTIIEGIHTDTLGFEVGVALHDTLWAVLAKERQTLQLPAHTDSGWVQSIQFKLPPGRYQSAFHVRSLETSGLGGYRFRQTVPDYRRPELSVSSILPARSIHPKTDEVPARREDFEIVAHPDRRFHRSDPVYLYFEIYYLTFGKDDRTSYTIEYMLEPDQHQQTSLLGRVFGRNRVALSVKSTYRGQTTAPVEYGALDVSQITPGWYRLRVRVTDQNSGAIAEQTLNIELLDDAL